MFCSRTHRGPAQKKRRRDRSGHGVSGQILCVSGMWLYKTKREVLMYLKEGGRIQQLFKKPHGGRILKARRCDAFGLTDSRSYRVRLLTHKSLLAVSLINGKNMEQYVEQYQARNGCVTLHTWTDVQGSKKENFYITGTPGTPIPSWFREVLCKKSLADIAYFPYGPSCFYA